MQIPLKCFPLNSEKMLASAIVLVFFAGTTWWIIRRTQQDCTRRRSRSLFVKFTFNPFSLFSAWAALQFVAYFAVLQVPSIYWLYNTYITAAILALLGLAPIWLAAQGECRFIAMIRERNILWKNIFPILLAAAAVCWAGFASFEHFNKHLPRGNPGSYRYAGYRTAAEWIKANAEPSDIIRIGEIGVFGWYCPLYIEDLGCLTMRWIPERKSRFRYEVCAADPRFPPSRFICSSGDLVASFLNPNDVDILVFRRR